jgi:small subunit ribosomal protein S35
MTSAFRCVRAATRRALPPATRPFSSSAVSAARRNVIHGAKVVRPTLEDLAPDDDPDLDVEDTTWAGHQVLRQEREQLYYMRLIEHEIPKLVGTWLCWLVVTTSR